MDIEKLLALFPQANLGEKQAGAISFRQGDAFLNIPAAELSEKERKILEIFLGKTVDFEVECGVWQDYLTKKSNVKPIKRGKIRFTVQKGFFRTVSKRTGSCFLFVKEQRRGD